MSEKFLTRIIELLNRAQPDGLTFDALTFHIYNSEQDFFGEQLEMRQIATRLRTILDSYGTHIVCDEQGAYHLIKGIPQQWSINFEQPQETSTREIIISEPTHEYYGEQLFLDLFEDTRTTEQINDSEQFPPPYPYPTLFDNDPYFV